MKSVYKFGRSAGAGQASTLPPAPRTTDKAKGAAKKEELKSKMTMIKELKEKKKRLQELKDQQ